MTENIYCLVRMLNRELNRDQNLIGGQMAVQTERRSTLAPLWSRIHRGPKKRGT